MATGSTGVIIDDGGYPNEGGVAGVVNNLVPYGDPGVGVGVGGGANGGGGYDGGVPGGFGHGSNSAGTAWSASCHEAQPWKLMSRLPSSFQDSVMLQKK